MYCSINYYPLLFISVMEQKKVRSLQLIALLSSMYKHLHENIHKLKLQSEHSLNDVWDIDVDSPSSFRSGFNNHSNCFNSASSSAISESFNGAARHMPHSATNASTILILFFLFRWDFQRAVSTLTIVSHNIKQAIPT